MKIRHIADPVEIAGRLITESYREVLMEIDGAMVRLSKVQCEFTPAREDGGIVATMPAKLAEEMGLD